MLYLVLEKLIVVPHRSNQLGFGPTTGDSSGVSTDDPGSSCIVSVRVSFFVSRLIVDSKHRGFSLPAVAFVPSVQGE